MKNVYPKDSDNNVKLLISEDIREEVGGKLSLLGYLAGNKFELNIPPNIGPVAVVNPTLLMSHLALLWTFVDGKGNFSAQVSLKDPNGAQIMAGQPQQITKTDKGPMNLIVKISPFIVNTKGIFECTAQLDKTSYIRTFEII